MVHFKLSLTNKENEERTITYCQLKISEQAIKILAENKAQIPVNFMEALRIIRDKDAKVDAIIRDRDAKVDAIIRDRDAKVLKLDAEIRARDENIA